MGIGEEKLLSANLEYRSRSTLRPMMVRRTKLVRSRSRSGSVRSGDVDTVYSTVVGEGRRVRRCGWVVSIAWRYMICSRTSLCRCGGRVEPRFDDAHVANSKYLFLYQGRFCTGYR